MASLESLLSDLPNIIDELNLNIGKRQKIKNEILKLDNILLKLNEIQVEIDSELGFQKIKNIAMGALPFLGTVASFLIPGGFLVDAVIAGSAGFLSQKFGNQEDEITLSDLQQRIHNWIEWVNDIKEIGEHILNDSVILNQINNYLRWENISKNIQKIDELIKINLAFNNADSLNEQIKQINNCQNDLVRLQQRTNDAYAKLKNTEDIYQIIIGLSNYYGNSGFCLEWLNDEHGLIMSSAGEFASLAEIIDDCEYIREKIGDLILNGNNLKSQAEEALQRLEKNQINEQHPQQNKELQHQIRNHSQKIFIFKPSMIIGIFSTIFVVFGVLIGRDKFPAFQQINLNINQEDNAKHNFESAQKLGMEASLIVQNPPHPPEVWEKSLIKWQEAISLLETIPKSTSISKQAEKQLSSYRINSQAISKRILNEKKAKENFELSQRLAMEASLIVQNPPHSPEVWKQAQLKWQQAIKLLEIIPQSTFVSEKAKEKLSIYKTNYAVVSTQVKE